MGESREILGTSLDISREALEIQKRQSIIKGLRVSVPKMASKSSTPLIPIGLDRMLNFLTLVGTVVPCRDVFRSESNVARRKSLINKLRGRLGMRTDATLGGEYKTDQELISADDELVTVEQQLAAVDRLHARGHLTEQGKFSFFYLVISFVSSS